MRMRGNSSLSAKVCLVTGGSRGLGRELALQLADQGALLALAARNMESLQETVRICSKKGARAVAIPTDIGNASSCRLLIQKTVSEYGRLDALLNNAGVRVAGRFDDLHDITLIDNTIRTNFLGAAYCTFYALPHLKESRGFLAAVASLAGIWAVPLRSLYSSSKFAMRGFFDSLREELKAEGVSVTVAYPGFLAVASGDGLVEPDGLRYSDQTENKVRIVPIERCARLILDAVANREPEVIISHVERHWKLQRGFELIRKIARGLKVGGAH